MKLSTLAEDVFYTTIVWLPILTVIFFISVVAYGGLGQLEASTNGTEYVIPNATSMGHPLHPVDVG